MSTIGEQIKQEYGVVETPEATNPESAAEATNPETPTDVTPESQPEATNVEDAPAQSAESNPANEPESPSDIQQPVFDWGHLSERTEGIITDEESFGSILEKAKQYDEISNKYTELESNQVKFANPLIEGLNSLVAQGATESQIETYWAINKLGDFASMDPREALISRDVLLNNIDREVAEYRVDSKYDFDQYEEGSIEYKALKSDQQLEARSAIKELEQFKKESSTVTKEDNDASEQARLAQVAQQAEYQKIVKLAAPKLAKEVSKSFNLGEGDNAISVSYSEDFEKKIPNLIEKYFEASGANPNDKSSQEAVNKFIEARYKIENFDNIVKDLLNKKESEVTEKITNKYTNPGGKPKEEINPNASQSQMSHEEWIEKRFGKR